MFKRLARRKFSTLTLRAARKRYASNSMRVCVCHTLYPRVSSFTPVLSSRGLAVHFSTLANEAKEMMDGLVRGRTDLYLRCLNF